MLSHFNVPETGPPVRRPSSGEAPGAWMTDCVVCVPQGFYMFVRAVQLLTEKIHGVIMVGLAGERGVHPLLARCAPR